ncbi:hypothetical protein PV10_05756 [Exophiala mesophila]|uniref:Ribosomal RNA-processing protein 43 n=1 Tax=Exophiala mesophila TaxID=212818 RepID=A0A0D1Z8Y9_EXOME|nr:uncharacterized protein PV10_05756 [Exophiala mesophila]KIV91192.1 hypothetical protein PV10_05756 [Exophiala mesophila]
MTAIASVHSSDTTIPASSMPLIAPHALLHAHLSQSPPRRPSDRTLTEFRPIQLNVGSLTHCNGSSVVKIGETTIVCGVRAEILPVTEIPSFRVNKTSQTQDRTAPSRRKNGNGTEEEEQEFLGQDTISLYNLVVPNIELATGCSPRHAANTPPSVEAQSISQRLLSLLHTSRLIRTSDLEIIYTPPVESQSQELGIDTDPQLKAYWTIYIDMMCISYGGSVFEAAWLALYAALKNTVLPNARWDADLSQVLCSAEPAESRHLVLKSMPVPTSFAVFTPEKRLQSRLGGDGVPHWILVDTDSFEEECCDESGCITIDAADESTPLAILRIEKHGGGIVDMQGIEGLLVAAQERSRQWKQVLAGALKNL